MRTAGMRVKEIADYYKMLRSTISNVVKRYKDEKYKKITKKRGPKLKLSPRTLRMFRNYRLSNYFEPLLVQEGDTQNAYVCLPILLYKIHSKLHVTYLLASIGHVNIRIGQPNNGKHIVY